MCKLGLLGHNFVEVCLSYGCSRQRSCLHRIPKSFPTTGPAELLKRLLEELNIADSDIPFLFKSTDGAFHQLRWPQKEFMCLQVGMRSTNTRVNYQVVAGLFVHSALYWYSISSSSVPLLLHCPTYKFLLDPCQIISYQMSDGKNIYLCCSGTPVREISSSVKSLLVITGSSQPPLWLEKNQCVHCGGFSLWAHSIFKRSISDADIYSSKIYLLLDLFCCTLSRNTVWKISQKGKSSFCLKSQVNTTLMSRRLICLILFLCVIKSRHVSFAGESQKMKINTPQANATVAIGGQPWLWALLMNKCCEGGLAERMHEERNIGPCERRWERKNLKVTVVYV